MVTLGNHDFNWKKTWVKNPPTFSKIKAMSINF